jgi:hypothetical protein
MKVIPSQVRNSQFKIELSKDNEYQDTWTVHSHTEHSHFSPSDVKFMHNQNLPGIFIDTDKATVLMLPTHESRKSYQSARLDTNEIDWEMNDGVGRGVNFGKLNNLIDILLKHGCDIRRFTADDDDKEAITLPSGKRITKESVNLCMNLYCFALTRRLGEVIYSSPHEGNGDFKKIDMYSELYPDSVANIFTASTDEKDLFQDLVKMTSVDTSAKYNIYYYYYELSKKKSRFLSFNDIFLNVDESKPNGTDN